MPSKRNKRAPNDLKIHTQHAKHKRCKQRLVHGHSFRIHAPPRFPPPLCAPPHPSLLPVPLSTACPSWLSCSSLSCADSEGSGGRWAHSDHCPGCWRRSLWFSEPGLPPRNAACAAACKKSERDVTAFCGLLKETRSKEAALALEWNNNSKKNACSSFF